MRVARFRDDEVASLTALRDLGVLDTGSEPVFEALVKAASIVCGVPISLISLIDAERQWFKANLGLEGVTETPRDVAFCAHAVLDDELFEIGDATKDERFADNPLVTEEPSVRFYAGIPLRLRDGHRVGTLCVIDRKPRELSESQRDVLRSLGEAASHALEGRRAMHALQDAAMETARSEAMLSVERRRLANIIDGAHVGTWDVNVRSGATKINARWAEIRGESLESLAPPSFADWFDSVHPDDIARARALFADHLAGKTERYECELRVRHRNGQWVWVIDRGRLMTYSSTGSPEWIVGARIDIEQQKLREDELRRSEQFLDRTGRVAGVGGWQVDLATRQIYMSDELCRLRGVPTGTRTLLGQSTAYYPPEVRPTIDAAVARCIETGEGWDLEVPFVRGDGQRIWARTVGSAEMVDGKAVRLVGAFQDITARVREHHALRDANDRIALATDSGQIGIWEFDLVDEGVKWDAWMFRIYGLPSDTESMTLAEWRQRVSPKGLETIEHAIEDTASGPDRFDIEFDVFWPSGETRHLRSAARLFRDESGRARKLVGATWDITESRALAAELRRQTHLAEMQTGIAVAANQSQNLA